ncbi:MAG: hypothetical protein EA403_08725 [Spirochaetaceae bacterium]|nr:MAG: hypothetical protein EA403_08725 [Spirochaetaceae bacterium]
MPRLEEIEKLGKTLLPLGNEPSVLARWGEDPEIPPTAAEEADPELAALLQGFPEDDAAGPGDELPDNEPLDDDVFSDLDMGPAGDESFDFDAPLDFDEPLDGADVSGSDGEPETEPAVAESAADDVPDADDFGEVDDFAMDDFETADFDMDAEAEEVTGDVPEDLDLGDFDLGEADAGDADGADVNGSDLDGADLEGVDEPATPDDAAKPMDDLDDFSFSEDEGSGDAFTFDPGEFEIDDEEDEISLGGGAAPAPAGRRAGGDDFAVDDFDTGGFGGEGLGADEGFDEGEQFSAPAEDFPEEEDDTGDLLDVDEFSLGDFGAQFGVMDEGPLDADEDSLNPAVAISDAPPEAIDASGPEVELTDEQFADLQRTLAALPLNVKLAVEEIVAESTASSGEVEKLIKQLVRGESAKVVAQSAGRILGKELKVPKGYEKRTGIDYEQERASLGYRFREYVWPVLRLVLSAAVVVALAAFLTYSYVWRPLHARAIYLNGLDHLAEGRTELALQRFAQAETIWQSRRWYYAYADAFIDARRYQLAVNKYEALLSIWPDDERGILDYARLESQILGNYEKAEALLERILDRDVSHYAALLAAGDNYLAWASEDPARFENARLSYARLINAHGDTDELLFRMLRFFIRAHGIHGDYHQEILQLKNLFEGDSRIDVDPEIYAELAGYLLDRDRVAQVYDILMRANRRAVGMDLPVPEIHYQLARFFRRMDNPVEEERALRNSVRFFGAVEPLDRRNLRMLIDTHGRLGEFHYERADFIAAEAQFRTAIDRFENARARRLLGSDPVFGRLYAGLGNIYYYVERNWEAALDQFRRAQDAGFTDREMSYRKGFAHFRAERYPEALDEFFNAAEGHTTNPAILMATGNALFFTGDLFPAEGIFTELLDETLRRRARIPTLLVDEEPSHRFVIETLIRAQNNLGVTYLQLARRQGDPDFRRRAMVHLQASQELAVNYRRSPETGARAEMVNLAQLNLREILYPLPEFDPQIYPQIPMDFSDLSF